MYIYIYIYIYMQFFLHRREIIGDYFENQKKGMTKTKNQRTNYKVLEC